MNNKLIEKMKKLLALSESNNENESRIAMLKVQELLVKHKMSMKEVKEYKLVNSAIKEDISNISFRQNSKWKAKLGGVIADNYGCYMYFKTCGSHFITFLGREEDVTVCNIVLEYAIDCIISATKRLKYQYSKNGYSVRGLESDYALGFISGLEIMFEEQKRKNQEWGLVLTKDSDVVEAYSNKNFKGSVNTNTSYNGFGKVYYKGEEEGKKFSISDKISREDEQLLIKDNG